MKINCFKLVWKISMFFLLFGFFYGCGQGGSYSEEFKMGDVDFNELFEVIEVEEDGIVSFKLDVILIKMLDNLKIIKLVLVRYKVKDVKVVIVQI